MESLQRPPPPHHYAALGVHVPGVGLDQLGCIALVVDPESGDHPQVCSEIN